MSPAKKSRPPIPAPDELAGKTFDPLPEFPIFDRATIPVVEGDDATVETASITRITRFAMGNMRVSYERLRMEGLQTVANKVVLADLPLHYVESLTYYQGVMDGVRLMMQQQKIDAETVNAGRVQ